MDPSQTPLSNFIKIKKSSEGLVVLNAHFFELVYLKKDMLDWLDDLKINNKRELFKKIQDFTENYLFEYPDIENEENVDINELSKGEDLENSNYKKRRENIVREATKHVGVPYYISGNSPKGFDCSGFTSYVYKEIDIILPRSAKDQFEKCTILKEKNVSKGDLVFFSNGSYISHVGIIVSNKGESLTMIHASSSKGIVITEISKSNYWLKRSAGFCSYLK